MADSVLRPECHVGHVVLLFVPKCVLFFFFLFLQVLDKVTLGKMLNDTLFGQSLAIHQLDQSLLSRSETETEALNAILLVGWVGTGKSLVAELIQDSFVAQSNVHKFSVPLHLSDMTNHYILDDFHLMEDERKNLQYL